jgi:hypothetical protein
MRTLPESSMRSPFTEYQMRAGVCWLLSFSKKRFRVVGTEAPVGERVTMGFTLPHRVVGRVEKPTRE